MRILFLLISFHFIIFSASAQNIIGSIIDSDTKIGLENSLIIYKDLKTNKANQIIADEQGKFIQSIPQAKYEFTFRYLGYKEQKDTLQITQIPIEIIIELNQLSKEIAYPIIRANLIPSANVLKINKDNFLKLPGSFNDPTRLLLKFPGISSTNDQANFISLKGMPPSLSGWFINGASVINPNHLSNTGTFTDQASANGGGVNMISGNSVGNYEFIHSPLNSEYFNVGSGLSNFELGVEKGGRFTLGLLGTEFGYGYNKDKLKLGANYRYSTLGILSSLGIPLGDEKINFQDFHGRIGRTGNEINWSVDVLIGSSSNVHESLKEESVFFKDALFVDLKQRQEIIAGKIDFYKEKFTFKNSINYSGRRASREIIAVKEFAGVAIDSIELINEQRISIANKFLYPINNLLGLKYTQNIDRGIISDAEYGGLYSQASGLLSLKYNRNKFLLEGAYGGSIIGKRLSDENEWRNNVGSELRFLIQYGGNKNRIRGQVSKGLISILPEIMIRGAEIVPMDNINMSIDYMRERGWGKIKIGGYYHLFNSVLVSESGEISYFSRFDLLKNIIETEEYNLQGNAVITGSLFQYQLNYKAIQFLQNFSYYNIQINETIESDFDFGHTYSSTISYSKNIKENKFLIASSLQGRGGNKEFAINQNLSELNATTIYENNRMTLRPYSRIDLKISYLWGKEINNLHRHSISLDIQNLLNRRNDSYSFYDALQNDVVLGNQLGLIPILSYTIRF